MTKIQLKRSNVVENGEAKKPTAEQTEFGELCVNYNFLDPALFIKDSNGNIIRIAGEDAFGQKVSSVNGKSGDVNLDYIDVGAASAAQGLLADTALQPGDNISELSNNVGYITTADIPNVPVLSVNGEVGNVILNASDVGALSGGENISIFNNDVGYITSADLPPPPEDAVTSVNTKTGDVVLDFTDVGAASAAQGALADSAVQPGDNISTLNNDAGYITDADIPGSPVLSVNGETGVVVLDAADVGAVAPGDNITTLNNNAGYITSADIPEAPVTSVNFKTGAVSLSASDVGALEAGDNVSTLTNDAGYITSSSIPDVPVTSVNGYEGNVILTAADVNAVAIGGNISSLFNDVGYITDADIPGSPVLSVNGFTGNVTLDASDVGAVATGSNISQLNNDIGYLTAATVPDSPVLSVNSKTGNVLLSPDDIGAATAAQGITADAALQPNDNVSLLFNDAGYITSLDVPVLSVNGQTGNVVLDADDVGALQTGDNITELSNNAGYITSADIPDSPVLSVNGQTGAVTLNASDVGAATAAQGSKADSALQPNDNISSLNNDAGYITSASAPSVTGGEGISVTSNVVNVDLATSQANGPGLQINNSNKLAVIPATSSTLGGIAVGNGLGVTANGLLSANVRSVNSKTGAVTLNAADVGAATAAQGALANSAVQPGDNVSDLNNDAGYITSGSVPSVGDGTITIVQPGTSDQTFTVNQTGNKTITLKNDNTVPSVGDGTITIVQPGTSNQTFTVNQSGNKTITLKNDNTSAVTSVNGKTGAVTLNAADVGAISSITGGDGISVSSNTVSVSLGDGTAGGSGLLFNNADKLIVSPATTSKIGGVIVSNGLTVATNGALSADVRSVNGKTGALSLNATDVGALKSGDNVSSLNNDSGYITSSSIPSVGNGTITIVQPGTSNQTFTVNQSGNTTITLKNDNTVVTPGNGSLTIRTNGQNAAATGSFTANQSGNSTLTLPAIRYTDLSSAPRYEQGTFTPTMSGSSTVITYTSQLGWYTIIGDICTVGIDIQYSGASGNAQIVVSLPITPAPISGSLTGLNGGCVVVNAATRIAEPIVVRTSGAASLNTMTGGVNTANTNGSKLRYTDVPSGQYRAQITYTV